VIAEAGTPVRPDPDPENVPPYTVPMTYRPVSEPTDVMFGWADAITLWAVGTVETFEPFMFDKADAFPVKS